MTHDHHSHANRRRLGVALTIVGVVLVIEVVGAQLTGSLALLGDAGHMFSDGIGLIVALIATAVAARPATDRQTFGFRRAEVFGALINGVILAAVAVFVAVEGVRRLITPDATEVLAGPMLGVAMVGLAANIAAFLVLRGGRHTSINMRGAYLEVLADMIGSIAAIVAALIILVTGFQQADAVASLLIAALIVPRASVLLGDVFRVLSESAPAGVSVAQIREHLVAVPGVVDVHDVHVWAITSGAPVFSAHVIVQPAVFESGGTGLLLDDLASCLSDHFDVAHSTFQLEPAEHADHEETQHP